MTGRNPRPRGSAGLPSPLRPLFWDCDFDALSWERNREFVIGRVLTAGDWEAVTWLRAHAGDRALRDWIEKRGGRGLDRKRLRFWELILGLSGDRVAAWLAAEGRRVWEGRTAP